MDLSNPSNWQLRYLQSFASSYVVALSIPIPTFDTPDLSDRILRVRVTSSNAKPSWSRAGKALQIINAGSVETEAGYLALRLNDSLLWQLQDFGSCKLRVTFPKYLTQATISIYGYTG